jgi:sulfur carrier protein
MSQRIYEIEGIIDQNLRLAMQIIVNGEQREVDEGLTAAQLVEEMNITAKRIAMEVNLEIVPRSTYAEYTFKAGDKVEIVHAVGGG